MRARAVEEVRKAVAVVEQKAPADATAFKEWLLHISTKVAEASKEGGFLGFGGIAVSDSEKVTLSEIANALKAELAKYQRPNGLMMDSSSWKVTARNPS